MGAELAQIEAHMAGTGGAEPLLMFLDGAPVGYLQWYAAAADADIPTQPDGTRGIDFFLGETSALGKGHGPGFLNSYAEECKAAGIPRLVADPDGRNISSVGCLGRAGFQPDILIGPTSARRLLMYRDLIPQPPKPREGGPSRRRRERP